jgi:hypothetical protein
MNSPMRREFASEVRSLSMGLVLPFGQMGTEEYVGFILLKQIVFVNE